MPERIVRSGETVIQALSAISSLLLVQTTPAAFECRGCISIALDCTQTAALAGMAEVVEHLEAHRLAGHSGAEVALEKLAVRRGVILEGGR